MKTILIISGVILLFAIFDGLREGYRERSRQANDAVKKYGYRYHLFGFLTRAVVGLAFVPFTLPDWYLTLYVASLSLWLNWVLYDGLTNLPKMLPGSFIQRFFYSGTTRTGTTSKIDLLGGEYLPFVKLFYTLGVIIITVIYLTTEIL